MKKLFTISFLSVSFLILAQNVPTSGNLNIFSDSGERFFMYLNGELQNKNPQKKLRIENLNQRYYNVKIVFEDKTLKDITKNYVSVIAKDGITFEEATYKIKVDAKNKKTKMTYFSSVPIIPDFNTSPDIYVIREQSSTNPIIINNGINININNNNKTGTESHQNQRTPKERNCQLMSSTDFQAAKAVLKKESFDDKKLPIAQNIISNNCLKAEQIAQIAETFSFSKNQMEFVKSAYNSCVDIKNYYQLKDVFSFEIDKKEFLNFINSK